MDIWLVYAVFVTLVLLIFCLVSLFMPEKEEKDVPKEKEEIHTTRCHCCCPCRGKTCRAFDEMSD